MMSDVSLLKCENYEINRLKTVISKTFDNLGGLDRIISPGQTVFLKVNAVSNLSSKLAYTTNPIFLQAVIQVLKQYECKIIVGDNPPFHSLKNVLKGNGMLSIINEEHVEIYDDTATTVISDPHALRYAEFEVSRAMTDCDVMINLPKLKTHSLTYFSGAVKNCFGFIPGLKKAEWHVTAPNPQSFSDVISDLYGAILHNFRDKKILSLADGITALEGDGPTTGGTARDLGAVIASFDAVALDAVAMTIMGLDISKSPITLACDRDNHGTKDMTKINVLGDPASSFNESLKEPEKMHPGLRLLNYQWLKNLLLETPQINHDICIGCGECTKICPPQTMKIRHGKYPNLNRRKCIRCWCCTEVCPKGAITKGKRPPLGRLVIKDGGKK